MQRRFAKAFETEFSAQALENLPAAMAKLGMHERMCVVKSICGGWCTTARFHEENRLGCIFGCTESSDNMLHYIRCEPLWTCISLCSGASVSASPSCRICLSDPSRLSCLQLVLAYTIYHTLKGEHREELDVAAETKCFAVIAQLAFFSGKAAWRDLAHLLVHHTPCANHGARRHASLPADG